MQTEQSSEEDNSEKISTKEDEDWYETVLQEMKKFKIKENEKLMMYEWSHWITCYNDECEEHHRMKKWNQYYLWEFWECTL